MEMEAGEKPWEGGITFPSTTPWHSARNPTPGRAIALEETQRMGLSSSWTKTEEHRNCGVSYTESAWPLGSLCTCGSSQHSSLSLPASLRPASGSYTNLSFWSLSSFFPLSPLVLLVSLVLSSPFSSSHCPHFLLSWPDSGLVMCSLLLSPPAVDSGPLSFLLSSLTLPPPPPVARFVA